MDKENLLSQQVNSILRCSEYPSKEQEQLLETSSQNIKIPTTTLTKRCYSRSIWKEISPFQQRIQIYSYLLSYAANALAELIPL